MRCLVVDSLETLGCFSAIAAEGRAIVSSSLSIREGHGSGPPRRRQTPARGTCPWLYRQARHPLLACSWRLRGSQATPCAAGGPIAAPLTAAPPAPPRTRAAPRRRRRR